MSQINLNVGSISVPRVSRNGRIIEKQITNIGGGGFINNGGSSISPETVVAITKPYLDLKLDISAYNTDMAKLPETYTTPAVVDNKINAKVTELLNAAPTTLDTLGELAKALGNDPNFATTVTNLIATKAPIASPNFTGVPTITGYDIYHAGNFNKPNVPITCSGLTAAAGTVIIKGSNYPQVQFTDSADTVRLLFRSGNNLMWRFDGVNDSNVWHSQNSNINTVDWNCNLLTSNGAVIKGTIAGTTGVIGNSNLTDANLVITGSLPIGMRFDRGSSGFLNTPYNVNNANGLLTLTSHPTSGTGTHGKQIFFTDNEELYVRKFSNGTASPWRNIWHSGNANLNTVDWNANALYSKLVNITGGTGLLTESGLINFQNSRARIGYDGTSQGLVLRTADTSKNIVFAIGLDGSNEKARINSDGFIVNGVVKSSNQNGSGFTATGWQVGDYSNLNNLDVRSRLQVYEFVQNKINISNGNLIVTDSAKVDSVWFWKDGGVTGTGQHVRYSFAEQHPFNVGDIIRCQYKGKSYIVTVGYIDNTRLFFDAYNSYNNAGVSDSAAGDLLVRWNSDDSNRKGLLYLNSSDTNAPNFQVIYNNAPKAVLGNIAGLNWKGTAIAANKYGVWADGDIYINNGYFSGEVNVTGGNAETTTGSQAKADAAQSTAISTAATNTDTKINAFKGTLGSLAYDSLVEKAKLGSSLISGGYIKTDLLDVNNIIVGLAKTTEVNTAMNNAITTANTNTTNAIGSKFTYITGSGIYTGTLTANQVTATNAVFGTANISNGAITTAKIASANITTALIADAAITNAKISNLDASKITTGQLTAARIDTTTITSLGAVTAGSFNLGNGTFTVSPTGTLTATGANITGTINATAGNFTGTVNTARGRIGVFDIKNDGLFTTGISDGSFITLSPETVGIKVEGIGGLTGFNKTFRVGGSSDSDANEPVVSIGNLREDGNRKIALNVASFNGTGYNTAIKTRGNISCEGAVLDCGIEFITLVAPLPATTKLSIKKATTFVVTNNAASDNCYIEMPTIADIRNATNTYYGEPFVIKIKIIAKYDTPRLFYVGYDNGEYQVRDYNAGLSSYKLSGGDSIEILIISDGINTWGQTTGLLR